MTWIAVLAGVFILLVGPPKPDRLKGRPSSSKSLFLFTFLFFLTFTFLLFYSFISPYSVLCLSVYNLFALLGRKAPLTHSLGVLAAKNPT